MSLAEVLWATPGQEVLAVEASEKAAERALEELKREAETPPRNQRPEAPGLAHSARAVSFAYLGLKKEAQEEAANAIRLAPNNHDVQLELAKTYELTGDRGKALARLSASMVGDLVPQLPQGHSPILGLLNQDRRFAGLVRESEAILPPQKDHLQCPASGGSESGHSSSLL